MSRTTLALALAMLSACAALGGAQQRDSTQRGLPRDVAREAASRFNSSSVALRSTERLEVEAGREVRGDVAVLGAPVTIAGHVTGSVIAINTDVSLRPTARIDGDLLVVGGDVDGRESAYVGGEISIYREAMRYRQEAGQLVAVREREDAPNEDRWWRRLERRRNTENWSKIQIASAGAYNRVEGLPINLGPQIFRKFDGGSARFDGYAILRTGSSFSSADNDVGHNVRGELRIGRLEGVAFGGRAFNVVEGVEEWQLSELEVGLASFLAHRDYRDYFQRHGGSGYVSLFLWRDLSLTGSLSDERWATRRTNDPYTLFRNQADWRPNPMLDEGRVHVVNGTLKIDTRSDPDNPWSGWYVAADWERGVGSLARQAASTVLPPVLGAAERLDYTRGFIDVRRYNRLSPDAQLNFRAVVGGWLNGDQLPLQRRLSVDGPGAMPGFGFRVPRDGVDNGTCNADGSFPGRPAMCERIALAQVEYRGDLHIDFSPLWNWNDSEYSTSRESAAHRSHVNHFRRDGTWVLFADAGRGWLVGTPSSTLTYDRQTLPALSTFRTDIGAGFDFGGIGLYLAKAISVSKEPARFFVRLHHRF